MNRVNKILLPLLLMAAAPLTATATSAKPSAPFISPHLADSTNSVTHPNYDYTPLAGLVGPGKGKIRRLRADEIKWKPVGPINAFPHLYSGPYPNGKRVIWIGGYDRVAKLDADTMEVLATYGIGGVTYYSDDQIERHIQMLNTLDKTSTETFMDYNIKFWKEPFRSTVAFYRMLSRENEQYLPYRAADGGISLRVYGDDATDPASPIVLRREWKIPAEVSRSQIMGMNMTSDGWIAMLMQDGVMMLLARDFTQHHVVRLPNRNPDRPGEDIFGSFQRNGVSTDNHGGIYLVTRDYLHRIQWTGSKLSFDEADGAWSVTYPNNSGLGSGTTPALMGWGPGEDKLVLIADGTKGNNMMAFWREAIPADWKGLPGFDRRVAGVTPIHFGVSKDERIQIENALIIYGYGAFVQSSWPEQAIPDQGNPTKQWMVGALQMYIPGREGKGGSVIRWDPQTRTLKTAWQTQTNFVNAICTVSGATEILYCMGARNREWTLEGTDWNTGKSAFTYIIGKDHRYNDWLGGPVFVAPNGAIDCDCMGGLGLLRIKPKEGRVGR